MEKSILERHILTHYLIGYKHDEYFICMKKISRLRISALITDSNFLKEVRREANDRVKYHGTKEYLMLRIDRLKINRKKLTLDGYLKSKLEEQKDIIDFNIKKAKRDYCLTFFDKIKKLFKNLFGKKKEG